MTRTSLGALVFALVLSFACLLTFAGAGSQAQEPAPGQPVLGGRRIEGRPPPPGYIAGGGGIRGPLRDEPSDPLPQPGQPLIEVPQGRGQNDVPDIALGTPKITVKTGPTYLVHPGGGVERIPDE